jgi:hypothetical protein
MVQPFPPGMRIEEIETDGATIHIRVGGQGPAVVMLRGFVANSGHWPMEEQPAATVAGITGFLAN